MKHLVITLACLLISLAALAQSDKRPNSYNYTRAVEAFQANNVQEALDYLNKELADNPKNGYAYLWLALVKKYNDEYGQALTCCDRALKYIPKKDKEYVAYALSARAVIYKKLEEPEKALANYNQAIKVTPENVDLYKERAQLFFEQEKYDLADRDYMKIIELDQGNVVGHMGLGRDADAQKRYDEAIEHYNYVTKLEPDYSSSYSFRSDTYIKQGKFNEAIDDVIKALRIDQDRNAFVNMVMLADSAFTPLVAKLKVMATTNPASAYWPFCLGFCYESVNKYRDAIGFYMKSFKLDPTDYKAQRIASCYSDLGDYDNAQEYIDRAIEMDSTETDYIRYKAGYYEYAGNTDKALATLNHYISKEPSDYYGYYKRGWIKKHTADQAGAIEDLTMAISLNPDYAYSYLVRGEIYHNQGKADLAKADFEKVIALDTLPGDDNTAQYAYYYLGQHDKALEFMGKILEADSTDNYYDAACLNSLLGNKQQALSYLEKALCNGFRRFAHISRDTDLDPIRNTPEFQQLIKKYQDQQKAELEAASDAQGEFVEKVSEVPFTREDGVCKVKCHINGLPLHFVFDTGASDVSISTVEATFMLKNDFLSDKDIIGRQNYMTANGEITEGTVINLRKVDFAGLTLSNIKASVVNNQDAPLLLGQSILSKLGRIEIDNEKRVLKITTRTRK